MLRDLPPNHDLDHLKSALARVTDFNIAIDAGAHKGIWTKEMLKHFKEVHSFEPWPDNYKALSRINKNVYNCALGDTECHKDMISGHQNTGQYHIGEGLGTVVRTLDSFFFTGISFLKIDVEGYELNVIKGALKLIERDKPVILTEENGLCKRYGTRRGETGKFIEALGYVLAERRNKDYIWIPKNQ